jgi:glucuronate isomerase
MRPIARSLTPGRRPFRTPSATRLYHWTHLELRRPFGITGKLLSPSTADEIWDQCNDLLAQDNFSAAAS